MAILTRRFQHSKQLKSEFERALKQGVPMILVLAGPADFNPSAEWLLPSIDAVGGSSKLLDFRDPVRPTPTSPMRACVRACVRACLSRMPCSIEKLGACVSSCLVTFHLICSYLSFFFPSHVYCLLACSLLETRTAHRAPRTAPPVLHARHRLNHRWQC